MRSNLQEMRKRAGYKSAKAFADKIGMSVNTYTNYEQGKVNLTLEKAWEFADILRCSLDDLAGREAPKRTYSDPNQAALNGYYESMNDNGKSALTESARLMSGNPETRIEKNEVESVPVQAKMGA